MRNFVFDEQVKLLGRIFSMWLGACCDPRHLSQHLATCLNCHHMKTSRPPWPVVMVAFPIVCLSSDEHFGIVKPEKSSMTMKMCGPLRSEH